MIDHGAMKLGKHAPVHDKRTLLLANYLDEAALALTPPARVKWSAKVTNLGMMANDQYGDCVLAAKGHEIQVWTANNGSQVIVPDADILKAYTDLTGFNPNDPSTDNGTNMLAAMNYWRNTGVGGHKIFGFVAQEPGNRRHIELAIDLFGSCEVGLALPVSAQHQNVWSVVGGPDGKPGTWGGHCVPIVDYGPTGPTCITWGGPKLMTWKFFETCCDEAYAPLSQDWATGTKLAPSGFGFATLQKDLGQIAH